MNNILIKNVVSLFLFASLIILIQLSNYSLLGLWIAISIFIFVIFDKFMKTFVVTNILFGIGFYTYLYVTSNWTVQFHAKVLHIFLNRISLIFILVPLFASSIFSISPFITYLKKPQWKEFIYFPFIWSGFHRTNIKTFLFIALTVNIVTFFPFIIQSGGWSFIAEVWLLAIIFSITNAVLEEIIWRGNLLSRFSEQLGEKWGVMVTSVGFGLQHYSLGFPWIVCIAFSIGGLFYGGITIKSRSVVPSMIWHFTINILMVFSGLI